MPGKGQEVSIPKISESLFFAVLPKDLRDHLMGDLYEEFFNDIFPRYGAAKARWWYRGQVLKSIRFYILKRKGDIIFFIFSIIAFIGLSILAAIVGKTGLYIFINIPSLIVVIIPSFIFAVAATSVRAWILGLKLLLIDLDYQEQKEIREASRFFQVFGNICLILGIFYTLFSAMQMLNSWEFPGTTFDIVIGGTMVCMLPLLYGIAIKCILYVADQRLYNRYLS